MTDVTTTTRTAEVREVAWTEPDAVRLRAQMSAEVDPRYADRLATMPPPPQMKVDPVDLVYVGLAYLDGRAVGHVAVRRLRDDLELKRMFVVPAARGRGVAGALVTAAEDAARAHGATRLILQTGDRQPEAVSAYTKAGYTRIPLFDPYLVLPFAHCFARDLGAATGAGVAP